MKKRLLKLVCVLVFSLAAHGWSQGGFENLGFESTSLIRIPGDLYDRVQFSSAFPGWSGYVAGVPEDLAQFNGTFLDSSGISIIDKDYRGGYPNGAVIDGHSTAVLASGLGLHTMLPADTTLSQTGLVPNGSQSLRFEARLQYGRPSTSFGVIIGGESLNFVPMSTTGDHTLYGADIHNWAGQTAELDFTLFSGKPHIDNAYLFLDAIQFSPEPIPEPNALRFSWVIALVFGGIAFIRRGSSISRSHSQA